MADFEALLKASLDATTAKTDFEAFKKKIENETIKIKLDASFVGNNANLLNSIQKQFQSAGQNASQSFSKSFNTSLGQQLSKTQLGSASTNLSKQIQKIQENVLNGSYDAKSSTLTSRLSSYDNQNTKLLQKARKEAQLYDNTLQSLKDHFDSNNAFTLNDDEVVKSFETMTNAAKKFDNTMTQIKNTQSKDLGLGVAERSANAVRTYYETNTKAIKKYGAELNDLENRYRSIKTVEEKLNLDTEFKNLKSQISAEGLIGKSFFSELGRGFKQIAQFAGTYGVIQRIPEAINNMYQEVVKVDTAMTNLYKVTEETSKVYNDFQNSAGTAAKELGRDISSYIEQTANWAKLGYSIKEARELSKTSSVYANVGEVDDATAVSDIVTAMKSFNIEASDSITIIDQLNKLGNEFATSSAALGEGLTKSASAMNTAGTDLNHTLAMLTGGAEIFLSPYLVINMLCVHKSTR